MLNISADILVRVANYTGKASKLLAELCHTTCSMGVDIWYRVGFTLHEFASDTGSNSRTTCRSSCSPDSNCCGIALREIPSARENPTSGCMGPSRTSLASTNSRSSGHFFWKSAHSLGSIRRCIAGCGEILALVY